MDGTITPVPMVFATCRPNTRKATKLKNEAQATASCGRSTRVATMVAIELAASWKPFRKSNASAIAIRSTIAPKLKPAASIGCVRLRVFQDDAFDQVRDILAFVRHRLQ